MVIYGDTRWFIFFIIKQHNIPLVFLINSQATTQGGEMLLWTHKYILEREPRKFIQIRIRAGAEDVYSNRLRIRAGADDVYSNTY